MPLRLHGLQTTRRLEQGALQAPSLMQRAGEAVARLAMALAPHARQVWIAAGPGNNGGDGIEAALWLHRAGVNVNVGLASKPTQLPADAHAAWQRASAAGVRFVQGMCPPAPLQWHDLALDALLGIGVPRPPCGALKTLLHGLYHLPCRILSVDLPSGLDAETGQPFGEWCVRATHTLSLLTLKPGLFTGSGRDHAGEVWWDSLGADVQAEPPVALLSCAPQPSVGRRHAQHKGSFGDVVVVGGDKGMTGAALLAARAAHAAGAGRVYVDLLQEERADACDFQHPELMFRPGWWSAQHSADTLSKITVVAGCGGGAAVAESLPRLLSLAPRLVLDADALNQIAADTTLRALLRARATRHVTIMTPHPLEAARLLNQSAEEVQADRLRSAQSLAETFRCVVLLKGSGSIIAAPAETPSINPTGNAALATAGTGDVLSGWIGGSWAASGSATARDIAIRGTWLHGRAGDLSQAVPLRASSLIDAMHATPPGHRSP